MTGSFWEGVGQLVRIFVSAFSEGLGGGSLPIENSEQSIVGLPPVPEYQVPGYLGDQPEGAVRVLPGRITRGLCLRRRP